MVGLALCWKERVAVEFVSTRVVAAAENCRPVDPMSETGREGNGVFGAGQVN